MLEGQHCERVGEIESTPPAYTPTCPQSDTLCLSAPDLLGLLSYWATQLG